MLVLFSVLKRRQLYLDSHPSLIIDFITTNEKQKDYKERRSNKNIAKKKKVGREWKECGETVYKGYKEEPLSEELFVTRKNRGSSPLHFKNFCALKA